MNKRFIVKVVAGALAASALLLGSLGAQTTAQASGTHSSANVTKSDTGWF